jgi:citronellol/citronellal dehydrogenase
MKNCYIDPMDLKGKTIVITGASRGIGREIALRCARDGANIVIAAKTDAPDPKLVGTIHTVAEEVKAAGGQALALKCDVRYEEEVTAMVELAASHFHGIDALINNAGAIHLKPTAETPMKRWDLMHGINERAVFLCTQKALPYLKKSSNPHIINLSPPFSLDTKWYTPHLAYTLSKYGMTLCTLGHAAEFKSDGIAVNSLWPRRLIATAATKMLFGEEGMAKMRKPAIMAEAAYRILTSPSRELTGKTLLDEDFLRSRGMTEFREYAMVAGIEPAPDLFVD